MVVAIHLGRIPRVPTRLDRIHLGRIPRVPIRLDRTHLGRILRVPIRLDRIHLGRILQVPTRLVRIHLGQIPRVPIRLDRIRLGRTQARQPALKTLPPLRGNNQLQRLQIQQLSGHNSLPPMPTLPSSRLHQLPLSSEMELLSSALHRTQPAASPTKFLLSC